MQRKYAKAHHVFKQAQGYLTLAEDHLTRAYIRYYLGITHHEQQEFRDAIAQFKLALRKLKAHIRATGDDENELLFEILRQLAGETFYQCLLEESVTYLRQADALASNANGLSPKLRARWRGIVHWLYALVHRYNHAPAASYHHAIETVACYREAGELNALPRAELVAAHCSMDLAIKNREDRVLSEALADAAWLIADARQSIVSESTASDSPNASAINDKEGAVLGQLADLRYRRLLDRGSHAQRVEELQTTLDHAIRIGDALLIGQAYIAIGDELAGKQPARACAAYSAAIKQMRVIAPILTMPPRRALERQGQVPTDFL